MRQSPIAVYRTLSFAAAAAAALLVACAPDGELLESVSAFCSEDRIGSAGAAVVRPVAPLPST